jgi:ubiquinol-cytochrome c reductase cytochrome c subunit
VLSGRNRRRRLGPVVVIVMALAAIGLIYTAVAPSQSAASAGRVEAVTEGRELFAANCSSCHGLNAQGGSAGPTLIGAGAASVDFQVGTGRMPLQQPGAQAARGPVRFSDGQIAALAAYIASLAPGAAVPSAEQLNYSQGNAAAGGELFRTNCAMCHNFAAQGGALSAGKYAPSLDGVSAKHIYEAMVTGPQSMPVFSDQNLSTEQKQSITKWLKQVEEEPQAGGFGLGKLGTVPEGLFGWVFGIGGLIGIAVWLGAKSA